MLRQVVNFMLCAKYEVMMFFILRNKLIFIGHVYFLLLFYVDTDFVIYTSIYTKTYNFYLDCV